MGSIRVGNKIVAKSGNTYHPDLFDVKWSDHILDNISWLRADTFSWQYGSMYKKAYQHLANDIDNKTLQSETVEGITVQYYLANDGHKICPVTQEENIQEIYTLTGIAWYYILDTEEHRFKLPRTKYAFTGVRNNVGKFIEAGLPNITGEVTFYGVEAWNGGGTGAFDVNVSTMKSQSHHVAGDEYVPGLTIDASRSSSIYGNSDTVQPQATEMYLYFYVGNYTQSALENTAGLNVNLFNNKVDKGHQVIEFQAPTAENDYTWYRLYADGWVEQGGTVAPGSSSVSFAIEFVDTNYYFNANLTEGGAEGTLHIISGLYTTTGCSLKEGQYATTGRALTKNAKWFACGMAA